MAEARCVVCPSDCYETFGRVVIEAFAAGTPVVASRIGALAELLEDGRTGRLFSPGDAQALVAAVRDVALAQASPDDMRQAARRAFEARYGAAANYAMLMTIYRTALGRASGAVSA
jgi:glycosyltransferase involved in cell wall biosynthesis